MTNPAEKNQYICPMFYVVDASSDTEAMDIAAELQTQANRSTGPKLLQDERLFPAIVPDDHEVHTLHDYFSIKPLATDLDALERVARAICTACYENPDHVGDAQGNQFRWEDYRDAAKSAILAM